MPSRAVAIAIAALLLVAVPVAASAHAGLVSSIPSDGAQLEQSPPTVTLRFTEEIPVDLAQVYLLEPAGPTELEVTAASTTGIRAALGGTETGEARISYRVTSADGHPIAGEISFVVEPRRPEPESEPGGTGARDRDQTRRPTDLGARETDGGPESTDSTPPGRSPVGLGLAVSSAGLLIGLLAVVVLVRRAVGAPR